jgi:hypothetical protein
MSNIKRCTGINCRSPEEPHSAECEAQHAAAVAGGVFLKTSTPELTELQARVIQLERLRGGYFQAGETLLLAGRVEAFKLYEQEMLQVLCGLFGAVPSEHDSALKVENAALRERVARLQEHLDLQVPSQVFRDMQSTIEELRTVLAAITAEPFGLATVWHEGSKSFYRAYLLRAMSAEEVSQENSASAVEGPVEVQHPPV